MKSTIFYTLWAILFLGSQVNAQRLAGTTFFGGESNIGVVYQIDADGANYEINKSFLYEVDGGYAKNQTPIKGSDGKLYGMTIYGGKYNVGCIYVLDADGTNFSVLKSFKSGSSEGIYPQGNLIQASDGKLYGMTYNGGTNNYGTVFRINPDGTDFTTIKNFDSTNGRFPFGDLLEASDGKLYGVTYDGGASNKGVIFSINKDGTSYTVIKHFAGGTTDGSNPRSNLIEIENNVLMGTTISGGSNSVGTIFKIDTDGDNFSILKNFTSGSSDGGVPMGNIMKGADGKIYGMTQQGGEYSFGIIYRIDIDGQNFTLLKSFNTVDGGYPQGSLYEDVNGNLYSFTSYGGTNSLGTLFKVKNDGTDFTVLKNFSTSDGYYPYGGVIEIADGVLLGLTQNGGENASGTLFTIKNNGTDFTILRNFKSGVSDGSKPNGRLIQASNGKIYGVAQGGGTKNRGVIYRTDANGSNFTIVKNFDNDTEQGAFPTNSLLEGLDGKLYGIAYQGGSAGSGVLFRINIDGTDFTVLKHFQGGEEDGSYPFGKIIQDANGNIYGITNGGGTNNTGTIYKIKPDGTDFVILKNILNDSESTDIHSVESGLILCSDGKLYGASNFGGSAGGFGTVFKLDTDGSNLTIIKNFAGGVDGANPKGTVYEGSDGKLYGTTFGGGVYSNGIIYRVDKDGQNFSVIYNFNEQVGSYGDVIEDNNGKLYGHVSFGGEYDKGFIYKLDKDGSNFEIIKDFNGDDGSYPYYGSPTIISDVPVFFPEINVKGNLLNIADGDTEPSPSDFTDFQDVGKTASLQRTFTIENTGNAPLTIQNIASTGENANEFIISEVPSEIAAGENATFKVAFNPQAFGNRNANIQIQSNDTNEAIYDFNVTGNGVILLTYITATFTSISLEWITFPDAIGYEIRYKPASEANFPETPQFTNIIGNSFNVTGLTKGTTYHFQVRAILP
jgi:uncharacterized repeat protein (TIGR03803 family)